MNNLFDKDFYPTPREVIERMLQDADIEGKKILEPSAGSGNIVDVLLERGAREVVACETDDNMRRLLSTKCNVIASDFLTLTADDVADIDMIVANVPFSDQLNHISHMIEIAPKGCEIITLCNATLFDKYQQRFDWRSETATKYCNITANIDNHGFHESYGKCFSSADRPTDVEVECIHIFLPGDKETMFDDFFSYVPDEEMMGDGIMPYNVVNDYVHRYVEAVKQFDATMERNNAINDLISPFTTCEISFGAFQSKDYNNKQPINADTFRKELQKGAWRQIFCEMKMDKYVNSAALRDLDRFISRQENFPFSVRNVYRMLEVIIGTHGSRMKQCLVDAFDRICSFSDQNSSAGEKWKTNSDYMVNRRFIVPNMCKSSFRGDIRFSYYANEKMDDINKALCSLTGDDYDAIPRMYSLEKGNVWGQWFDWGFFRCKCFKKGTMHFEFKEENVWRKFNSTVAEIKGWSLPADTSKIHKNANSFN